MLKFLRKYQLILLAVGGSLLMVVFLLEPVLRQLTPDPRKRTVATIGADYEVSMGEQVRANIEVDLLERFLPTLPVVLGLDAEDPSTHWLLLKHEAERLGVMGVEQDGAAWLPELAFVLAQQELFRLQQSGQQVTPEMRQSLLEQADTILQRNKRTLLANTSGLSEASFNQILSHARGVLRLKRLYEQAPRLSRQRAVRAFERLGTGVLIDQVVLGPELVLGEVSEPSEEELAEHLAQYADREPGQATEDDPFGFGYLLPARVQLEWLELDPRRIAEVVQADPVQVRRRWQEQGEQLPFEEARGQIAAEIRRDRVQQILIDADEIIRGEILAATRSLEKEGIYRVVPEDWTAPDLERIAGDVVEAVQERHGVRIVRPSVIRRNASWLTPAELRQLPGVGRAVFRVGTQEVAVSELPALARGVGDRTVVPVQVGVPIVDPVATTPDGARYYITLLGARPASPPSGVDEIRDRLVGDVRNLKAYRLLVDRMDVYRETATRDGLDALVAMFAGPDGESPVELRENIFVSENGMGPATFESFPDARADREEFREAVMAEAADVDPLAEPDTLPLDEAVVGVAVPSTRVLAFGRIRAKSPVTAERFRQAGAGVVAQTKRELIAEAEAETDPLRLDAMTRRLGFARVGNAAEDAG